MSDQAWNDYSEIMAVLAKGDVPDFFFVQSLVEGFPEGVDGVGGRRWIVNAIDCGSLNSVNWMLGQTVNLAFRDKEGRTVLHACLDRKAADRIEVLRALIAAGADVNAHGTEDWTPLHMALARGNLEALDVLLAAGADRTIRTRIDEYESPEEYAVRVGYRAAIARFRKQ